MPLEIVTVACLSDNYAYLVRDGESGTVALVDAPEADPIEAALDGRGWDLGAILITHHHGDHVAGVDALRSRYGAKVVGAKADAHRLPRLDRELAEGDSGGTDAFAAQVLDVPGHTVGHIAYYFPEAGALFSADSLMALGCGRLFEGTPEQMWSSLSKLAALPPETMVYSGHEYSESNARFALTIDPDNPDLVDRARRIGEARSRGEPTVPVTLALEAATNPFLRASDPGLKSRLGLAKSSDAQVFAEIRRRKDAS